MSCLLAFMVGEFGIQAFCLSPSGASERALGQPPDLGVFGGPMGLGTKGQVWWSGEFTRDS